MSVEVGSVRAVAVVVTFNRAELLTECLDALRAQTHRPSAVVVIDNASTDETAAVLAERQSAEVKVTRLHHNTGGAGGFALGIEQALELQPDVIWLLDDDTIPEPSALAELLKARAKHPGQPAVLASRAVWTDGRDHPMNTPREKPGVSTAERTDAAQVGAMAIRSASFVSLLCDAHVVRERGLPIADYFLWNDDFEYSTRLLRDRVGLYVPASVVVHKTKAFGGADADPGDRFYFEVRNKLWMFARSSSLTSVEKVGYIGATARRWARTLAGSSDRSRLIKAGVNGVLAASTSPRLTRHILAQAQLPPLSGPQPFSVLMSTWRGDNPQQLRLAVDSVTTSQTRKPAEVVLVKDGPLTEELESALAEITASNPIPLVLVELSDNRGLGPALQAGLDATRTEIVARMDTDDLAFGDRFEKQLPIIEAGADIVGAGIVEFETSPEEPCGIRVMPTTAAEIRGMMRWRQPFNHPTIVFRKQPVLDVGGYPNAARLEDFLMMSRLIAAGAQPANLAEPLLYYRVGGGAFDRRGGMEILRSEIHVQRKLRSEGLLSKTEFARNVLIRGAYRLVPTELRKPAYRRLFGERSGNG